LDLLAIHQCKSRWPSVWYGLHFTYFFIVLAWGAYLAYETRDIWQKYNYPNESRSILLSIYNLGFCGIILIPLVTALDASSATVTFLIAVAVIFPTTFALLCVHGPKVIAFLENSRRGNSKSREKETTEKDNRHDPHSHTAKVMKINEREKSVADDVESRNLNYNRHRTTSVDTFQPSPLQLPLEPPKEEKETGFTIETEDDEHPEVQPDWRVLVPSTTPPQTKARSVFDSPDTSSDLLGDKLDNSV